MSLSTMGDNHSGNWVRACAGAGILRTVSSPAPQLVRRHSWSLQGGGLQQGQASVPDQSTGMQHGPRPTTGAAAVEGQLSRQVHAHQQQQQQQRQQQQAAQQASFAPSTPSGTGGHTGTHALGSGELRMQPWEIKTACLRAALCKGKGVIAQILKHDMKLAPGVPLGAAKMFAAARRWDDGAHAMTVVLQASSD